MRRLAIGLVVAAALIALPGAPASAQSPPTVIDISPSTNPLDCFGLGAFAGQYRPGYDPAQATAVNPFAGFDGECFLTGDGASPPLFGAGATGDQVGGVVVSNEQLPRTGSDPTDLTRVGLLLVGAGAAVVLAATRRRPRRAAA